MRNKNLFSSRIFILIVASIILALFALAFISFNMFLVSATKVSTTGLCSQESQTIMRISSATNAHGEVWNNVPMNYNEAICYNTIFGSLYAGSNPQTCTGTNKVIRLSAATNAHAESPSLNNYATDVCYGNLVCNARSSCQSGEREILSLSSDTNAHLASDSSYAVKICCSSATAPPCTPNCAGNVCGDDGCGGSCGACPSGQSCVSGQCVVSNEVCDDGLDNDANGEWDYDTLDRGAAGNIPPHGDAACAISVTAISVSDSNPGENTNINVYCTSSVADVNSIDAFIDSTPCIWNSWAGNIANFTCNVGSYTGSAKTARCTVNATKSYQSGSNATASINVLPSSCSGYASSASCEADTACDWCGECSGTKYNNLGGDRCVNAGSCSYSCWKDRCGAGCDNTQGGWTNYVCDNYCSGGALYVRNDITNTCQDNCMPTTNTCADGTATSCGTTSCTAPLAGSCNNPCIENGSATDGLDASCGTCTPACIGLSGAKWANLLNNNAITSANANDTVRLIVEGTNLNGSLMNFTIFRDGGGCGLLWLFDCEIASLVSIAGQNSASTTWQASEAGIFYFNVRVGGTGQEAQSGNLVVYSTEDNSAPVAVISRPANGAMFEINTLISFAQSSYDEDDDISITWNFDDGNTTTFTNCLTGANCSTMHTFTTQGTKNVILTATDARGRTDTDFASIDIFQGGVTPVINVFSRISNPQPNQVIQGAGWIYFNASSSYAANCSTLPCQGCYQVGSLWCLNLDKNPLMFNWTFDDGSARFGTWQGNYSYVVQFNKFFGSAGVHTATLKVGYP